MMKRAVSVSYTHLKQQHIKVSVEAKAGWEPSWLFVTFQFLYIINELAESGENDIPGGMNGNGS